MIKIMKWLIPFTLFVGLAACGGDESDEPKVPDTEENGDDGKDDDEPSGVQTGVIELNPTEEKLIGFWDVENLYYSHQGAIMALFPNGYGVVGGEAIHWRYDEKNATIITDGNAPQNIISLSGIFADTWAGYFINLSNKQINLSAKRFNLQSQGSAALSAYFMTCKFERYGFTDYFDFLKDVENVTYDMELLQATSGRNGIMKIRLPWSEHPIISFKGKEYIGNRIE